MLLSLITSCVQISIRLFPSTLRREDIQNSPHKQEEGFISVCLMAVMYVCKGKGRKHLGAPLWIDSAEGWWTARGIVSFASLVGIDFFKGDCCFLIKTLNWLIVKLIQLVFFTV